MRNGTQEELDAAREDATKIPFDVLFVSTAATTEGERVSRVANDFDDKHSVAFETQDKLEWDFHDYRELKVINDN